MVRRRRKSGLSSIGKFLLLVVIISTVLAAANLGPERAWRIGAAAISNEFLDRPDKNTEHLLPVIEIEVAPSNLEQLNSDLPWSGGTKVPVIWKDNGIDHPGTFRYRGLVAPTHYLGNKKSFRLNMRGSNPYRPLKVLNVINPKSLNMLNNHLALWIGGHMGVPVPFDELVYVRMNGADYGVMELFEQVNGNFERVRNLSDDQVPVYKGDFPPLKGKELPPHVPLWKHANNWQYASKADSTHARKRLEDLISLLRARGTAAFDTLNVSFRDSLATLIDVPDMLRYFAALKVLNTMHIDNYHNQWLVLNSENKFYPILWDPLMMFPPQDEPWYPIHDALAYHVLSIPEWRVERDRIIHGSLEELHTDSAFLHYFVNVRDRLRPSLMADPNKYGAITADPYDVFPFSSAHAAASSDKLLKRTLSYWDRLEEQMQVSDVQVQRRDSSMRVTWKGTAAIRLVLGPDTIPAPSVTNGAEVVQVFAHEGEWSCWLVPEVEQRGAEKPNAYADRTWYQVRPADLRLEMNVPAHDVQLFNAVTDAKIPEK